MKETLKITLNIWISVIGCSVAALGYIIERFGNGMQFIGEYIVDFAIKHDY